MTDIELLQQYAASGSEAAFTDLVNRHAGAVYASALRQLRDPSLADEVVQAVFILLARKASSFKPGVVLSGWLFRATQFAANDLIKAEFRRQRRETTAYHMNATEESSIAVVTDESLWERVAPVLDQCLAKLAESDRHAILLRFFQDKSLAEVGTALGIAEDAARKRVSRAIDRLHALLTQNGAEVPAESLSPLLAERSSGSVPNTLAAATIAAAVSKGVSAKASTTTLAGSVSRQFLFAQAKNWAAVGAAVSISATALSIGIRHQSESVNNAIGRPVAFATDDYRKAGFEDPSVVHSFIADLQTRTLQGDHRAIAQMVKFPLQINTRGGKIVFQNETELLQQFDIAFRPTVLNMVLKCPRTGLYCDDRGVMIGSGEVWLAPEGQTPRIIALNVIE